MNLSNYDIKLVSEDDGYHLIHKDRDLGKVNVNYSPLATGTSTKLDIKVNDEIKTIYVDNGFFNLIEKISPTSSSIKLSSEPQSKISDIYKKNLMLNSQETNFEKIPEKSDDYENSISIAADYNPTKNQIDIDYENRLPIDDAYLSTNYKFINTEEIALDAVTKNGLTLKHLPDSLKTQNVIIAAVNQNPDAIQYAPFDSNPEISLEAAFIAVNKNGLTLRHIPDNLKINNLVLAAEIQNPDAIQYAPK